MSGAPYYKILGLEPTATDAEVKRRFRELAKQYHPDKNPSADATIIFQQLLDAYERILKKDFGASIKQQTTSNSSSHAAQHREFHRKAWERYEHMRKEQERELNAFYDTFIQGPKLKLKILMGILASLTLICLISDEFLPVHQIADKVTSYNSTRYQSVSDHFVNEIVTGSAGSYFVADYQPSTFESYPKVVIHETAICRLSKEIIHTTDRGTTTIQVHFTFYWIRWLLYAFLLVPIALMFYRKRTTIQVLASWFSFFIVGATMALFFISNFRLISMISLGNWP